MVILLTPVPTQAEKHQEEGKVKEMDPIRGGQIQLGHGSRVLGSNCTATGGRGRGKKQQNKGPLG